MVYGGQKRVQGIKFQSLALPSGLIGNLSGPYVGKQDNSTMLTSLGCSQIYRDQHWHNNQPLCIYGDPAYPLSIHLQVPFSRQNLTPNPASKLQGMSQTRVSVEWLFNEIEA